MDPVSTLPPPPEPVPIRPDLIMPAGRDPFADPFEPSYPAWLYETDEDGVRVLAPPAEPREDQLKDWAQNDVLLYGERNRRFLDDLRLYRQLYVGVPNQYNPDTDDFFISSEAAIQVNKVAAMISQSPHRIMYPWRTAQEREAASNMEAFALWFLEQWMVHHRNGTSDLKWDLGWYALIYGRAVTQVTMDLTDSDFPWWVELHDPATCFPVYGKGKHGMLRMTRRYTAATGDILDELDPTGEKNLAAELAASRRRGKVNVNDLDLTEDRQVDEIYTRWHRWMAVDGLTVELVAHEYGIVPFSERLAPGEAGTASAPDMPRTGLSESDIRRGFASETATSRQRDMAQKGQSFFHAIRHALAQREKVLSLSMVAAAQSVNPATIDTTPNPIPPAKLDVSPGKRNYRKPYEATAPAIPNPRPFDASTLLAQLNTEVAKGLLPDVIFGQTEGSNITGFASDSLIAAAKDRIGPYFGVAQDLIADTVQTATILFRNHGHLVDGLPDGSLIVPRVNRGAGFTAGVKPAQSPPWAQGIVAKVIETLSGPPPMPGMPPMPPSNSPLMGMPGFVSPEWNMGGLPPADRPLVQIDRETIDRVSARPKVSLETLGLNNRTVLINYLSQAVQAKLMPRATAMEQLPEIEDALEAYRQILAEDAQTDPEMLRLIYYPRALAQQGDVEGFLTYWATVLLPAIQQSLMVPPGMPPGGGGGPGQPPGAPPGGGGQPPIQQPTPQNAASGVNPAAIGQGPGSQGAPVGRPG